MFNTPASLVIKLFAIMVIASIAALFVIAPKYRVAEAQEPSTIDAGSFTIEQDTTPETTDVWFRYKVYFEGDEIADFRLYDDDDSGLRFVLMEPGTYTILQRPLEGWDKPTVSCPGVNEDAVDGGVKFELRVGREFTCRFTNARTPEPTATAVPTQTATATATSTATPVPAATQAATATAMPTSTAAPVVTTVPQTPIKPPSVGDGGLLP